MMKIASVVVLALLPFTIHGQGCASLCADGSQPGNLEAELPVPGVGPISCELAASLIPSVPTITPEQCTAAQAAASVLCECPTAPPPDVNLPCAFCLDGSTPTNPDEEIEPTVPIPQTGGAIEECSGLVALASTLTESIEDTATCALIQTYSTVCGCPAPANTTAAPEEPTTVVPVADEGTTVATVDPVTTEAVVEETTSILPTEESTTEVEEEGNTTAVTDDPLGDVLIPTASPAPSFASDLDTNMPTSDNTGTGMPVDFGATEPPVAPPSSIITRSPTAELTSAGYAMATKSTVCGAVLGMLVTIIV